MVSQILSLAGQSSKFTSRGVSSSNLPGWPIRLPKAVFGEARCHTLMFNTVSGSRSSGRSQPLYAHPLKLDLGIRAAAAPTAAGMTAAVLRAQLLSQGRLRQLAVLGEHATVVVVGTSTEEVAKSQGQVGCAHTGRCMNSVLYALRPTSYKQGRINAWSFPFQIIFRVVTWFHRSSKGDQWGLHILFWFLGGWAYYYKSTDF